MPQSGLNLQVNIDPQIKTPVIHLQKPIADVAVSTVQLIIVAGQIAGAVILCATGLWIIIIVAAIVSNVSKLAPKTRDRIQKELKTKLNKNEQALQRKLMLTNILIQFREMILPNNMIDTLCQEKEADLAKQLLEKMKENHYLFEEVVQKVGEALEDALSSRAEQAVILIK